MNSIRLFDDAVIPDIEIIIHDRIIRLAAGNNGLGLGIYF